MQASGKSFWVGGSAGKQGGNSMAFSDADSMLNSEDDRIALLAVVFLAVFSIAGIVLFFAGQQQQANYSLLYFTDYSPSLQDGMFNFSFAIENHEISGIVYSVEYFIGSSRVFSEEVSVEKGFSATVQRSFSLAGRDYSFPEKLTVKARASSGKTYSLWFWVTEN